MLDARIPISSQKTNVKEYTKNKNKIMILNKSNLVDEKEIFKWVKYFNKQNISEITSGFASVIMKKCSKNNNAKSIALIGLSSASGKLLV